MVKRALFFSTPYSLSLRDNQMIIRTKEAPDMQRTVPVEDIGVVVLEDRQTSVTLPLLNALSDNNAAVIFCGDDRMPNAMLMNLDSNRTQGENYRTQIEASEPLKKGIWRQIVEAKIRNQAALLQKLGKDGERLKPITGMSAAAMRTTGRGLPPEFTGQSCSAGISFVCGREMFPITC